ncbi:sugar ABC transporter substrate-binding protein [Nonomuraea sp. LP-02]|uniref:sugar ABC transporter substrate-binding protein n=1 Tax=Nonomuraea sp. LP-02 TaxID=3097960 RepID=UPI002E34749F|nr:sugar ABC transporter substrate-binding protein [Nonomuraea sp. LP-02]MED7925975.1 sugar ABC transporter substrate-binding protein [Nonomuraea sp. LP-02]
MSTSGPRRWPLQLAAVTSLLIAVAACGGSAETAAAPAAGESAAAKKVFIGFANFAEPESPVLKALDTGIRKEAEKRSWDLVVLNNDRDGPTAVSNAETMVAQGVTHAIEFQGDGKVAPQLMDTFNAAGIPVIAIDIAHPGAHFFGINNTEAGRLSGLAAGNHAKEKWDCKPDLVTLLENEASGDVALLRTEGILKGLKEACPGISDEVIQRRNSPTTPDGAQGVARDILVAKPDAKNILALGGNDNMVIGTINAAEQLGRAGAVFGYGLGADLMLFGVDTPGLGGSTAFWYEGYAKEIFKLLDQIVGGKAPAVVDSPTDPNAHFNPACQFPIEHVKSIPTLEQRIEELYAGDSGSASAAEKYCPEGVETYGLKS